MIIKISGAYAGLTPKGILLEVDRLTYEVCLTGFAREGFQSKEMGAPVSLYTIYYIESSLAGGHLTPTLIGFTEELERDFFQLFTGVAKIGVKTALAAITVPVAVIAAAVENSDAETLKKLKGIGDRTAHKIIASLRGKVAAFAVAAEEHSRANEDRMEPGVGQEALQVLLQLGYNLGEAKKMIREAMQKKESFSTTEDLLEEIYKNKL